MRWFCVHPALPDNATLRVRSYPSSDAPELGRRVPKGRAVAVVAPEFEVVVGPEEDVHRWVRVVIPDAETGEERDGFVMARLPDGTELLTPWHRAGFGSCCRVDNPKALLFDGPMAEANVVGLLDSTDLPYGVLEVEGSRALIQHTEYEHVWIDTSELDPVASPLHHSDCSVAHSFFTLNEALPPEAQIAIRTFPSKEADTVGLLSRGDILEVSFKSGPWLQIATAGDGDAFWIMWTTETLELLVEVVDHGSPRCIPIGNEPISDEAVQEELSGEWGDAGAEALTDDRNTLRSEQVTEDLSEAHDVEAVKAGLAIDGERLVDGNSSSYDSSPADARPSNTTAPGSSHTADVETSVIDVDDDQVALDEHMASATASVDESKLEASWDDRPIKSARQQQFSWDDRPIQPSRPIVQNGEATDDTTNSLSEIPDTLPGVHPGEHPNTPAQERAEAAAQDRDTSNAEMDIDMKEDADESSGSAPDNYEENGDDQDAIADHDERPIRPARQEYAADERPIRPAATAIAPSGELSSTAVGFDPDERPITPPAADVDTDMDTSNAIGADISEGEEVLEAEQQKSPHPDDRPIRPAQQQFAWDERPIQPAQPDDNVDSDAHPTVEDVVPSADERSSRPAPSEEVTEMHTAGSADIENVEEAGDRFENGRGHTQHPDERPIKPAQDNYAWDERPIRPVDTDGHFDDDTSGILDEQPYAHPDERPIRPAKQASAWDRELDTDASKAGEPDTDASSEDVQTTAGESWHQPVQQSFAWDERPIRQVHTSKAADESSGNPDASKDLSPSDAVFGSDEQPADPQVEATVNVSVDGRDYAEDMETDGDDASGDADHNAPEQEKLHSDDRFIRPTQAQPLWDDRPIKLHLRDHTWDDVPLLPTSEDVEMEIHSADEIDAPDLIPPTSMGSDTTSGSFGDKLVMSRKSDNPESEPSPELDGDGYSFLTQFGIAAYCNWKKRSMTSLDELSQLQYDALVEGDVDMLLETLAADVDIIDEWLKYVPVDPASVGDMHSDPSYAVDVLYDRDSMTMNPLNSAHNDHATKPPMVPLSPTSARKAKLRSLFQRLPRTDDSASVFDVIMNGGNGDSIIEAEVADDDSDFALTSQFRYPTIARRGRGGTPGRPMGRHDRNPAPVAGGASSLRRAVSAGSVAPPSTNAKYDEAPAPTPSPNAALVSRSLQRVLSTPDAKADQLKRPTASIAKTTLPVYPNRETHVIAASPVLPPEEGEEGTPSTQDEIQTLSVPPGPTAAVPASRTAIAAPSTSRTIGIAKPFGSSLPASSLARPRPLVSRLSAPSSISSIPQRTGSLLQPSSVSRSALPTRAQSTTVGSGIPPSTAGGTAQSMLPRRSMLPTPTKPSGLQAPTAARAIAQATSTTTLEARRASFGFARPRPSTLSKTAK